MTCMATSGARLPGPAPIPVGAERGVPAGAASAMHPLRGRLKCTEGRVPTSRPSSWRGNRGVRVRDRPPSARTPMLPPNIRPDAFAHPMVVTLQHTERPTGGVCCSGGRAGVTGTSTPAPRLQCTSKYLQWSYPTLMYLGVLVGRRVGSDCVSARQGSGRRRGGADCLEFNTWHAREKSGSTRMPELLQRFYALT